MSRQIEPKKDRRQYVDRDTARPGSVEKTSCSRLQPIIAGKTRRLPPLNDRRLPELKLGSSDATSQGGHSPLVSLTKPDVSTSKTELKSVDQSIGPNPTERLNSIHQIESVTSLKHETSTALQDIRFQKKREVTQKSALSQQRTSVTIEKPPEKPKPHKENPMSKLPEPMAIRSNSKLAKLINHESNKVDCRKEKELLRQHRKQQAERMKATRQPLKATQAYDILGKELMSKEHNTEKTQRTREVQNVNLAMRRKCDDGDDWDWDKDIEEYMNLEKIEAQSTSGQYTTQNGGRRLNPVLPANSSCSKRGVGFKSKKRVENERLQVLARQEEERQKKIKEKEKRESMLPEKIKKTLTRYGFK